MSFTPSSNLSLSNAPTVSICLVGNSTVGKTSLIIKFRTSEFNEEYVPRQYTGSYVVCKYWLVWHYSKLVWIVSDKYDGYSIKLLFYDTIGLEDFDHVNSQFERVADIYLLCFALNDRQSFLDLVKYIRQLNSIKGLPLHEKVVFLVGTKSDSFECENSKSISGNDLKSIQRDVKRKISVIKQGCNSNMNDSQPPKIEFLPLSQGISSNSPLVQKRIKQEETETIPKGAIKLPYPIPNPQSTLKRVISTSNTSEFSSVVTQNDETTLIKNLKQESKKSHTRQRSSSTGSLSPGSSSSNSNSLRPPHPTRTFDNKPRTLTETLVSPRIHEQHQQHQHKEKLNSTRDVDRTYMVSSEEISSFLSKYPIISGYIECSSKDGTNISSTFTEVLKIYYKRMKIEKLGKEENCLVM